MVKEDAPNIFADVDVVLDGEAEVIRVAHSKV